MIQKWPSSTDMWTVNPLLKAWPNTAPKMYEFIGCLKIVDLLMYINIFLAAVVFSRCSIEPAIFLNFISKLVWVVKDN